MSMPKISNVLPILIGVFCVYLVGYAYARASVFQAVERYAGPDGKSGPRQDYIAKKDHPAGHGWEYQIFLPAIKLEEALINYFHSAAR